MSFTPRNCSAKNTPHFRGGPDMSAAVRVTGTTDPAEIAAVIAAISAARVGGADTATPVSGYEQWRQRRVAALRASRGR